MLPSFIGHPNQALQYFTYCTAGNCSGSSTATHAVSSFGSTRQVAVAVASAFNCMLRSTGAVDSSLLVVLTTATALEATLPPPCVVAAKSVTASVWVDDLVWLTARWWSDSKKSAAVPILLLCFNPHQPSRKPLEHPPPTSHTVADSDVYGSTPLLVHSPRFCKP